MATYGLFKNGENPESASPAYTAKEMTWGEAVKYFAEGGFGGGTVYDLDTGKLIATVAEKKGVTDVSIYQEYYNQFIEIGLTHEKADAEARLRAADDSYNAAMNERFPEEDN